MHSTRRQFLQRAGIAAISACAATSLKTVALADEAPSLPIIDTHQHIWDLSRFRLPWLLPDNNKSLNQSFLPADYMKAIEGTGINQAIYMEVAADPAQRAEEAAYALDLCHKHTALTVAAVIAGNPADDKFRAYITKFKDEPLIKGVREPYVKGAHADARFVAGVRLLGELGMRFDLITDAALLPETPKLVAQCPHTRFILDHCGNGDFHFYAKAAERDPALRERRALWEEGIAKLADAPNVICKISGVVESGTPAEASADAVAPIVDRCLDRFGDTRVIFAGNWPVVLKGATLAEWLAVLKSVTARRGAAFQRKLFHDNARAFYGLKVKSR